MSGEDGIAVDETVVRSLLEEQFPAWAGLPLSEAKGGRENAMYRLGDGLVVRLPRNADNARLVRKERTWLPRLGPLLSYAIPEPVHAGHPSAVFPYAWSVYRWIDGQTVGPGSVDDWAALGADLAGFVRELHAIDLMGASRSGDFCWYRGGTLQELGWVKGYLREFRAALEPHLDTEAVEGMWRAALALPEPSGPAIWLHGDLRPGNLVMRDGRLHAVIDFGRLSIGFPDAEHATIWGLPRVAREAYRKALGIDEPTWTRARAWAIAIVVYYWHAWPASVDECRALLEKIIADV